jgi:hypothetical protein
MAAIASELRASCQSYDPSPHTRTPLRTPPHRRSPSLAARRAAGLSPALFSFLHHPLRRRALCGRPCGPPSTQRGTSPPPTALNFRRTSSSGGPWGVGRFWPPSPPPSLRLRRAEGPLTRRSTRPAGRRLVSEALPRLQLPPWRRRDWNNFQNVAIGLALRSRSVALNALVRRLHPRETPLRRPTDGGAALLRRLSAFRRPPSVSKLLSSPPAR